MDRVWDDDVDGGSVRKATDAENKRVGTRR